MKTNLAFALFASFFASQVHAMDLTGIEIKEIPIRVSKAKQDERAVILQTPKISESDWVLMSPAERFELLKRLAILDYYQREYLTQEAEEERAFDARVNPEALCKRRFGAEWEYSGRVEQLLPNNQKQASYLCSKHGPSKRTAFEKRMIQLQGYVAFVKFKLRNPFKAWPG